MIITKDSNVQEVADFYDLLPGQVLYLGMILKKYPKVKITGFGGQAEFAPVEDD